MVECEYDLSRKNRKYVRVLIDTWWNVNATGTDSNKNLSAVLIDTWWNVNAEDCHTLILTDTF